MAAPLAPWASIYDVLNKYAPELIDDDTGQIDADPAVADQWVATLDYATWMLWVLSRGAVHAEECWIDTYKTSASCKIQLRNAPLLTVVKVEAITVCGDSSVGPTEIDYCLDDVQTINVCCSGGYAQAGFGCLSSSQCGCRQTAVRVYYRTASTLPPGTEYLVGWLTNQIMLQGQGKACELPQRVTSVTRQQVSWSFVDPMDFVEKGLTGIGRVDTWLMTVKMSNPSSRLLDPLRSQLRSSQRVICAGAEFDADEYTSAFNITTDMVG